MSIDASDGVIDGDAVPHLPPGRRHRKAITPESCTVQLTIEGAECITDRSSGVPTRIGSERKSKGHSFNGPREGYGEVLLGAAAIK